MVFSKLSLLHSESSMTPCTYADPTILAVTEDYDERERAHFKSNKLQSCKSHSPSLCNNVRDATATTRGYAFAHRNSLERQHMHNLRFHQYSISEVNVAIT